MDDETNGWSEAEFRGGHVRSCAAPMSWLLRARPVKRSPPNCRCRRRRCTTGGAPTAGWTPDAAKELKELREQNGRLKRLLAEAELEKDALREVAKGKF
jgi:hypothetical protein